MRCCLLAVVVACGSPPAPRPEPPKPEPPKPVVVPVVEPARQDFAVGASPSSIAVVRGTLVFSDTAGGVWSMPATGGTPVQLSDQQHPSFAFHLFTAGGEVFATSRKELLRITVPSGPVVFAGVGGLADLPEESAADDAAIYLTVFKRPEIVKVPVGGGKVTKLATLPRGVLGLHGATLYAASYSTGALVAIPTAGGAPRTLARGLPKPTAVAADASAVFVYCEGDRAVHRIDIASGATTILARDLINSDDLVVDGGWLYAYSWDKPGRLVRIPTDGAHPAQTIASDLASPSDIAFDDRAIYVTSRDRDTIVRLGKAALPSL